MASLNIPNRDIDEFVSKVDEVGNAHRSLCEHPSPSLPLSVFVSAERHVADAVSV